MSKIIMIFILAIIMTFTGCLLALAIKKEIIKEIKLEIFLFLSPGDCQNLYDY